MSRNDQQNSDPLPYTQVDRAVKPKAALLAGYLGVTVQHALGSLVEFWDLCGDPREIERLVAAGQHEIILTAAEVQTRFAMAAGKPADVSALASLGLLEPKGGDAYRVRGMSRYFTPVERRVQARQAASAGGKASARARKERTGTAQPRSEAGSESGSSAASSAASESLRAPLRERFEVRSSDAEAESNTAVSGQRSAVSGHPNHSGVGSLADQMAAAFKAATGSEFTWDHAQQTALRALTRHDEAEVMRRWRNGLATSYPRCAGVPDLVRNWNAYATAGPAGTGKPKRVDLETQNYRPAGEVSNDFGIPS